MRALVILLCLALVACTPWQRKAGAVAVVAGTGAYLLSKKDRKKKEAGTEIIQADLSGTMLALGGSAISPIEVLHVKHWHDVAPVKEVTFRGNDGKKTSHRITKIHDLGKDLVILEIDPPLREGQHSFLPVADPVAGQPLTVHRMNWPPLGLRSDGAAGGFSHTRPKAKLETGDSGKIQVQLRNGKPAVVSLNSKASGKGPHVAQLLREWRKQTQITPEK